MSLMGVSLGASLISSVEVNALGPMLVKPTMATPTSHTASRTSSRTSTHTSSTTSLSDFATRSSSTQLASPFPVLDRIMAPSTPTLVSSVSVLHAVSARTPVSTPPVSAPPVSAPPVSTPIKSIAISVPSPAHALHYNQKIHDSNSIRNSTSYSSPVKHEDHSLFTIVGFSVTILTLPIILFLCVWLAVGLFDKRRLQQDVERCGDKFDGSVDRSFKLQRASEATTLAKPCQGENGLMQVDGTWDDAYHGHGGGDFESIELTSLKPARLDQH